MSITFPTYFTDMQTLNEALASQGYPSIDYSFISNDGGTTGSYFYPCKHQETTINFRLKYDENMKFHTIEELSIYTIGANKTLTTNPFDPRKFSDALEVIMDEANARLHKNIEYDGFVRPDYAAALMAETIEDAYELYHS